MTCLLHPRLSRDAAIERGVDELTGRNRTRMGEDRSRLRRPTRAGPEAPRSGVSDGSGDCGGAVVAALVTIGRGDA
jgi:hypothetical protein